MYYIKLKCRYYVKIILKMHCIVQNMNDYNNDNNNALIYMISFPDLCYYCHMTTRLHHTDLADKTLLDIKVLK